MSGRIFLIAAESSGDAVGADLIEALRARDPTLAIAAIGGAAMAARGAPSRIDISGLSVLGFIDGLKAYGRVVKAADAAARAVIEAKAEVVVLIDSWGFTLRVARRLRAAAPHIKLVKYIGPQVWATRAGRAKTLAESVDHLICIHDFEPPYYTPFGLPCTIAGHPAIGRFKPGDGAGFRARHQLGKAPLLLILPGSRSGEIRRIGPTLWAAATRLKQGRPLLRLAMVAAGSVADAAKAQAPRETLIVGEDEKDDAFAAATVALAASGTVTTEVALQGAPLVIGYKMGWLTWALARAFLFKAKFATLMNVAAQKEAAPELIQTRFTPENIAREAARLLDDESTRRAQIAAQNHALDLMGRGQRPAAEIAADAALGVLRQV